jgi:hypothetical protein
MSLSGSREQVERDTLNVISLFKQNEDVIIENDPLESLLAEGAIEETTLEAANFRVRRVVTEDQFPDQSLYILEEQLKNLRNSMNRIKFYLGDIDDLLPR